MSTEDDQVFILRVKAWDGSRIVGVYKDLQSAYEVQESFVKRSEANPKLFEEFEVDIIEQNRLSVGSNITVSSAPPGELTMLIRRHIYND